MQGESQVQGIKPVQGIKEPPMKGRLTGGMGRERARKPGDTRQGTGKPGTECGAEARDRKVQKAGIKRSERP